jgi:hypothetical protein
VPILSPAHPLGGGSKLGPGYPTSYVVVFFVFSELRWEVIARFVDIGVIVDDHCLNFLSIIYDYHITRAFTTMKLIFIVSLNFLQSQLCCVMYSFVLFVIVCCVSILIVHLSLNVIILSFSRYSVNLIWLIKMECFTFWGNLLGALLRTLCKSVLLLNHPTTAVLKFFIFNSHLA